MSALHTLMPGLYYWRADIHDMSILHGPFVTPAQAAIDAWHKNLLDEGLRGAGLRGDTWTKIHICTPVPSVFRTDIFGRVDELFDEANDDPATPDDPPSCAWRPDHLGELHDNLRMALEAWLARHGYRRSPQADALTEVVVMTQAELRALGRLFAADKGGAGQSSATVVPLARACPSIPKD